MAATMKDIARETGLGLATISSYFNGGNVREKNRIKIEAAIASLHFEVNETARGLKTNRTHIIGIVIPELNNIFCAEIISEAEDILRKNGYATMLCDCRTDVHREEEAVEFLARRRVDGLLLMPSGESGGAIRLFQKQKKPVVLIDRKPAGVCCDSVLSDNAGAAREAVRQFIASGHRKIGLICGPEEIYTARERKRGFFEALTKAGIEPDVTMTACGDYTIHGGARAVRELRERHPEMTAVLISNYEMTVGAMIEINESGISVPDALSVIGFDNPDFARACSPRLSILTQPTREIAGEAVRMLLERLENGEKEEASPERTAILPMEYREGKSISKRN